MWCRNLNGVLPIVFIRDLNKCLVELFAQQRINITVMVVVVTMMIITDIDNIRPDDDHNNCNNK